MNGKARPAVNFFAWVSNIDHRSTIRPGRVGVSPRAPRLLSVTESIALPPFVGDACARFKKSSNLPGMPSPNGAGVAARRQRSSHVSMHGLRLA